MAPVRFSIIRNLPQSGMALMLAGGFAVSAAWSSEHAPPEFRGGRTCWAGSPCAMPSEAAVTEEPKAEPTETARPSTVQSPKSTKANLAPKKQQAQVGTGKIMRVGAGKIAEPPHKKVMGAVTATAAAGARFYRYPMMYRGEAPPPMPPGNEQPYVQASQGVWYWPGADSIKIQLVPGFDPSIDPAKVIKW